MMWFPTDFAGRLYNNVTLPPALWLLWSCHSRRSSTRCLFWTTLFIFPFPVLPQTKTLPKIYLRSTAELCHRIEIIGAQSSTILGATEIARLEKCGKIKHCRGGEWRTERQGCHINIQDWKMHHLP